MRRPGDGEDAVSSPRFHFGAMSPYSWLAAERIDALIADAEWRPLFLGGIFQATGGGTWGLTDRRKQGMAECERRARERGLGTIRWPEPWPTSDVLIARAMIFAHRRGGLKWFATEAMRLAFTEGVDLGERDAIEEAGRRSGFVGSEVAEATGSPEIKLALRAANDEAVALGVTGVPTVAVGESLFWGDDRLEEAAAVRGGSAGGVSS